MKWGHFYLLDQWELREQGWDHSKKELWHIPCNSPVHRARNGPTWVCTGCHIVPPEEMLDVILLGLDEVWKGWADYDDSITWAPTAGTFYLGTGFTPQSSFYINILNSSMATTFFYLTACNMTSGFVTFS